MVVHEKGLLRSFRRVKSDMRFLQKTIRDLHDTQQELIELATNQSDQIQKLEAEVARLKQSSGKKVAKKTTPKKVKAPTKKKFVASKFGKVFHLPDSPQGEAIAKENRIYFSTAKQALNKGYKPSSSIKDF